MMETKFTPGPWQVITVTDRTIGKDLWLDTIAPYLISGEDGVQIGRVDDEFTNRLTPNVSALANAHLIAAAPDLYSALLNIFKSPRGESLSVELIIQMHEAIDKATPGILNSI